MGKSCYYILFVDNKYVYNDVDSSKKSRTFSYHPKFMFYITRIINILTVIFVLTIVTSVLNNSFESYLNWMTISMSSTINIYVSSK